MVATPSTMLELGTHAPAFALENAVDGRIVSLRNFEDARALLVMFICNHCPYVKHVLPELGRLDKDYTPNGLAIVAINSNDVAHYPEDSPANMKKLAKAQRWSFPFLFDETQEVAKAYRAACTPDFYLFDKERMLAYRGQLDDTRPSSGKPPTGRDLRAAIDAVLAGKPASEQQVPSIGCNIKWKKGNEPDYF
jgi:thiol-disulfide isomerase/thioredoxin